MSKRSLPGPHADRFAGVDFNMSSTPNETPQRATAAQLATRKIKEINRRRVKPSTTPTAPQASFSFGGSTPTTVSPSINPAPSNGFTFGQSQSFPAAGSSSTTQNGSQSQSFGSGGSTSFSFSGFNSARNNPFTNLNGDSTTQPQTQTSNLFGVQSSSQSQSAISSGSGIFGQTASSSSPFQSQPVATGSNLFGQSVTAPTSSSVFQSKPAPAASSLFGQSTPASSAASSNPFAQSSAPPASASQSATATTASPTIFGQQFTSGPAPAPSLFQTQSTTAPGSSLFGQNFPASTTVGTNLFEKPKQATSSAPNMFGQTTASPAMSLFGQSAVAKNEGTPDLTSSTQNKPSDSLFGQASSVPSASTSNTFNFGQPAASETQKSIFSAAGDVDEMSTSPDGKRKVREQTSTPSIIFGQKAAQTSASSVPETTRPTTSLFGTSTSTTAANPPSGNLFAPQQLKPAASNGVSSSTSSVFAPSAAPASSHPFQSLFAGTAKPGISEIPATSAPATSTPFQPSFASASKPAFAATTAKTAPAASSAPSQPLFTAISEPAQAKPMFTSQPSSGKRLGSAIMDQGLSKKSTTSSHQVPSTLSSDDSLDYNKRLQIRDLNRGFKELVSSFDPDTQSLDSVILHYIRLRKAINAPVGSMMNKPGKRKLDDVHGVESPIKSSLAKKSKAQDTSPAVMPEPGPPASALKSSLSTKRKSSDDLDDGSVIKRKAQSFTPSSTTQPGATGKSETSSIFASSFSSAARDKTSADGSSQINQFAVPPNSSSLFAAQSTTSKEAPHPASPPKTIPKAAAKPPAFEVPKFGNLAGQSFAGQFGKGSFKESSKDAPKVNLEVPKFGTSGQSFLSQFAQQAQGDDDSDEDSDSDAEPVAESKVEKKTTVQPEVKTNSPSIFDTKTEASSFPTSNIFGHLTNSNTTSDAGESDDEEQNGKIEKPAITSQPAVETETESKGAASLFGRITRVDGTPVYFSSDEDRADTPKPKPLFGQSSSGSFLANSKNTPAVFNPTFAPKTSNIFGAGATPSSNPFNSINPNPATHLLPKQVASTATSVTSDSNAEDTDTETHKDAQLNLMTNAGEEGEDCIFEGRSRGLKFVDKTSEGGEKTWEVQGVGSLRFLVNSETKRARIVLRAEPSGRAVLNTAISRAIDYKVQSGSCSFLVPRADGSGMDMWALRFKKEVTQEVESALKTARDSLPN